MDSRAQTSIGLARYVLGFIGGAVIIWILNETTTPLLNYASNATSNSQANQATTWISDWISWMPVMFLLIGFIGLIVYSIFIRGTGR